MRVSISASHTAIEKELLGRATLGYLESMLGRGVYENLLYPLKKRLCGASMREANRVFCENLAKASGHAHDNFFAIHPTESFGSEWNLIKDLLPKRAIKVIDVGCGRGQTLGFCQLAMGDRFGKGTGIDLSSTILEYAKQDRPQFTYLQADLTDPLLKLSAELAAQADLLICHSVLQNIPRGSLPLFLSRVATLTAAQGICMLAWWAPYFIDERWVIPFAPGSHRHRVSVVSDEFLKYFAPVDATSLIDARRAAKALESNRTNPCRKLLTPFHPQEIGLLVGRRLPAND